MGLNLNRANTLLFSVRSGDPTCRKEALPQDLISYHGLITHLDKNDPRFVFQCKSTPAGGADGLLCCFLAGFTPPMAALESLLDARMTLQIFGRHVVPSVYKPFEFEVASLQMLSKI